MKLLYPLLEKIARGKPCRCEKKSHQQGLFFDKIRLLKNTFSFLRYAIRQNAVFYQVPFYFAAEIAEPAENISASRKAFPRKSRARISAGAAHFGLEQDLISTYRPSKPQLFEANAYNAKRRFS